MMKLLRLSAFTLACLTVPIFARGELKILEGEHTVVYDVVNPRGVAFIPDYANESFEQKVTVLDEFSRRVTVTSRLAPMKTRVPFPVSASRIPEGIARYLAPEPDRQSNHPAVLRTAAGLTKSSRYAHEAANAVLSWIADNVTFDTSITTPSDALSVLRLKKAYCVGYSNLAVALLRAAGIPARVAHGYLPPGYEWGFSKEYWGVKVNDGGYHAYLEIYYPDTGWVFSDAEHSYNFVDPYHILLRVDGATMPGAYQGGFLETDKATFYTIYRERDTTAMVDELSEPAVKRLGRRLDERQHAALVSGRVSDRGGQVIAKGSVVLWKDGRGVSVPFSDGKYAAIPAATGKYRIEVKGPGYAKSSQEILVEQGRLYKVDFTLSPGGTIRGRVLDRSGKPVPEGDVFYREGNTSFGVPIDRDGTYKIEGLAPGIYSVSAMVGEREITKSAQADVGKETILDFNLP